jgi:membrane protein YdbS with pleckstrin-like domain
MILTQNTDIAGAMLYESTPSFTIKIVLLQLIIAGLSATITVSLFYFFSPTMSTPAFVSILIATQIIVQILDAMLLAYIVLRARHTSYKITPDEVVVSKGILNVESGIYKSSQISDVKVKQSLFGKLFDYGTVAFQYPPTQQAIELVNIPRPWLYADMIIRGGDS